MTAREIYEAVLVEVNKVNAQTFLIEEFNYYMNKAIMAYANERYNFYAVNQQLTDDLRVLLNTIKFNTDAATGKTYAKTRGIAESAAVSGAVIDISYSFDLVEGDSVVMNGGTVEYTIGSLNHEDKSFLLSPSVSVPIHASFSKVIEQVSPVIADTNDRVYSLSFPNPDYFHVLSCRTWWKGKKRDGSVASICYPSKRLTHDILNVIENNVYMRPAYNRTYYFMQDGGMNNGIYTGTGIGYQNKPTVDIHVGRDKGGLTVQRMEVDYLMIPIPVELTDVDVYTDGADTSRVLEFPDYLKNQFVTRVVDYLLEHMKDQRIQTHNQFNQEIPKVPLEYSGAQQNSASTQRRAE